MLKAWQYWLLNGMGGVAVVLVGVNAWMQHANQRVQTQLNASQQYVQQSVQMEVLYREMAQAIATLAVRNGDAQLKSLLTAQGIAVNTGAQGK